MKKSLVKRIGNLVVFMMTILSLFHISEVKAASDFEEMEVNIRKRAQWTDADDGDALLTLQYSSKLGSMQRTPDMNIMIIQDKSGSMDSNYGYNLEVTRSGWENETNLESEYYPILNSHKYSEAVSDIAVEGYDAYFSRLIYFDSYNGAGCHKQHKGYNKGMLHNAEMFMNSPCQMDDHYYLVIKDIDMNGNGKIETDEGEIYAWRMVHGVNLYNIEATDLHQYLRLDTREEALDFLEAGRRVVRMTSGYYLNGNSQVITVSENAPVYFVDMTEIVQYSDGWILSTCDQEECQSSDRLRKSQEFLINLVNEFVKMNPENEMAYIPFWSDVPENGTWKNQSGGEDGVGLYPVSFNNQITKKEGVTKKEFASDVAQIIEQIENSFTYNGTNWSIAFQNAIEMIEKQIEKDEKYGAKRETLVIFLTDGQPQGYAGQAIDVENPLINGDDEVAALKAKDRVTIFSCGVCINNSDGDIEARLNAVDTTDSASYARSTSEFSLLVDDLLTKIYNKYLIQIYGKYAFYSDTLSDNFELDESALDKSWKILQTPYPYSEKGVPYNVYSTVVNSSVVNKVYVKSTKTIYWYIGELDDGSYEKEGHTTTVPITYNYYDRDTDGSNTNVEANTMQKMTYYTNYVEEYLDEDEMAAVTIETPQLVFNRSRSCIGIRKYIRNSDFDTEQSYQFAYSATKYSGGDIVKDVLGTFTITIPVGSTSNDYYLYDLAPGIYYFYEIDDNYKIINSTINTAAVTYKGTISTQAYSDSYPYSVTKSDSGMVNNIDNVLTVQASAASYEYFYNYYTSIHGTKTWIDNNNESGLRPSVYKIKLYRNGEYVKEESFPSDEDWSFSNLERDDCNGKNYIYTVDEEPVLLDHGYQYIPTIDGTTVTNTLTRTENTGDITVVKKIPHNNIRWEHGNPVFAVHVYGKTENGEDVSLYHTFEFTKEYVETNKNGDYVSMSYTFENIPYGTRYYIEEAKVSRYDLVTISYDKIGGGISGVLLGNANEGFYDTYGYVMLISNLDQWTVTLTNKPTTYQWYSHRAAISNVIEW